MNNLTYLIGRLVRTPEVRQISEDKKITNITVAVPRNYKNVNGDYDTDFFDCILWNGIAETTSNYCKLGDLIGIKGRIERTGVELRIVAGRLQSRIKEDAEGNKRYVIEIVAEKISFLSSKRTDE